jgi:hypothetical protein
MQYVVFLASLLAPVLTERPVSTQEQMPQLPGVEVPLVNHDASGTASLISDTSSLPLCAALTQSGRLYLRTAGRRTRGAGVDVTRTKATTPPRRAPLRLLVPKWTLAVFASCIMLLIAPTALSAADEGEVNATTTSAQAGMSGSGETGPTDALANGPTMQTASSRRSRNATRQSEGNENGFPRRPFWGMPNVVVNDPASYPRPQCLENNDPSSFWYSLRPNIFNVPVEPEWDFYNIINTDRPDFTDAVYSVGKGVTYLETGFTYTKINTADLHINTRQLPEALLRYGLTDEFEIRLKWTGYLMTNLTDPHSGARQSNFGSEDLDTGFKWEILQQQGWRPMTTLVAGMTVPSGSPGTSANYVQPHFNLLFGWGIRRWLYIKQQIGCDFIHSSTTQAVTPLSGSSNPGFVAVRSPPNSWHESISVLTQWTKRVGAFHEWFMISPTGGGHSPAQHFLDMGLYLYATPNVQFDVRVGRQLSNRVDDFFTGAGFSGRW